MLIVPSLIRRRPRCAGPCQQVGPQTCTCTQTCASPPGAAPHCTTRPAGFPSSWLVPLVCGHQPRPRSGSHGRRGAYGGRGPSCSGAHPSQPPGSLFLQRQELVRRPRPHSPHNPHMGDHGPNYGYNKWQRKLLREKLCFACRLSGSCGALFVAVCTACHDARLLSVSLAARCYVQSYHITKAGMKVELGAWRRARGVLP
jgi:hypothetical protein